MLDITTFGAVPNSGKLSTEPIQAAIDAAGTGTVRVPRGEFITGTLNLRGASLYLDEGAVLKGSPNIDDYVWNGYHHNEMGHVLSLIYSMENESLRIWGSGTIDLNGDAFYHLDQPNIPASEVELTPAQVEECTRKYDRRPSQPIFFYRCKRIVMEGIRIINAPCWTVSFIECEDIRMLDLTIDNSLRLPNDDGMHFCSCRNVFIRGCNISAGDDCIALSCITDWNIPCERVVISDCILRSCSKAIVIGYMHSVVRDVCISNVVIYESNRGIALMSSTQTGLVENVQISNVRIDTKVRAGNWWGNGEAVCIMAAYHHSYAAAAPDRHWPVNMRNITLNGLACSTENALAVVGEGGSIRGVRMLNVSVVLKDSDNKAIKGNRIDLAPSPNMAWLPDDGRAYWLYLKGAQDILVENAWVELFHGEMPAVYQSDCANITVR